MSTDLYDLMRERIIDFCGDEAGCLGRSDRLKPIADFILEEMDASPKPRGRRKQLDISIIENFSDGQIFRLFQLVAALERATS